MDLQSRDTGSNPVATIWRIRLIGKDRRFSIFRCWVRVPHPSGYVVCGVMVSISDCGSEDMGSIPIAPPYLSFIMFSIEVFNVLESITKLLVDISVFPFI